MDARLLGHRSGRRGADAAGLTRAPQAPWPGRWPAIRIDAAIVGTTARIMLKVRFIHVRGDAGDTRRSGWYITDGTGAIVPGTGRFEHQASAIRAASARVNAPVAG